MVRSRVNIDSAEEPKIDSTRLGEKSRGQLFTARLSCLCFVHPVQAVLNSIPQLPARDRRAVAQSAELGPGDLRMDAAAQAAVGAGDDVFSAGEFGERENAIGYQFRVLDEIGGVAA